MIRCTNQQNRDDHVCSRCDRPMAHGESYWRDEKAQIVCDECHGRRTPLQWDDDSADPWATKPAE